MKMYCLTLEEGKQGGMEEERKENTSKERKSLIVNTVELLRTDDMLVKISQHTNRHKINIHSGQADCPEI